MGRTLLTRGNALYAVLLLTLEIWAAPVSAEEQHSARAFTVRDSIELGRVLPFGPDVGKPPGVLYSKDRSKFLVLTRTGSVQDNVNIDALLVFRTSDVERYLSQTDYGTVPVPRATVRRRFSDDSGQIGAVQWVNNEEFAFISQGDNQQNQVLIADADTGMVSQLTKSPTHVVSFAIDGGRVAYFAHVANVVPHAMPVVNQSLLQILRWDTEPNAAPLGLFAGRSIAGEQQRIALPDMRLLPVHRKVWLSPSGTHAVVLGPSTNAPLRWARYQAPDQELSGYGADKIRSDAASWDLIDRVRFYYVDLVERSARPLLDAPSGWLARSCTPMEVIWLRDERSVIVSNTFLPVGDALSESHDRRLKAPAIAEVDVESGTASPIAYLPSCAGEGETLSPGGHDPIVDVLWNAGTKSLQVTRRSETSERRVEYFRKTGRRWESAGFLARSTDSLVTIALRQGLNYRPRLVASGGECHCDRVVFDPAPWADAFTFGPVKEFRWVDSNGTRWKGALVLPPGFDPTQRYPLVVQTHGFDPEEFLIDGPHGTTTAMAAQPLANAGFVVLQVQDNPEAETADAAELYASGYRAGIDALVRQGIADQERVGMIAFSRTGLALVKLLADQPDLLRAATLADSGWWGYLMDLILFNYPQDLANQAKRLTGGEPDWSNVPGWIARNPLYRMPHAHTAVRIEANGSILKHWEHYALLKKAGRPVDLIFFPYGSHVLKKPDERLESQGGNVDWFRFWLLGEIDHDPHKASQYDRWCRLPDPLPTGMLAASTVGRARVAACEASR